MKRVCAFLFAVLPAATALHAQVVSDSATNVLDSVTNATAGDVTVGTNGSFTLLILTNGALLTNSGNGYIGRNAGANSNTVRVTGANTRWLIQSNLFIGSNGAFNLLVVSNGALVGNSNATIGSSALSSNNAVVVTGTGSFWSNRGSILLGDSGGGNSLEISNGGKVRAEDTIIGANSSGNRALVTGSNSLWSNRFTLFVGQFGNGNLLVVSNGAQVTGDEGRIGSLGTSNQVTVTGASSHWSNQNELYIAIAGTNNRLLVENAGRVSDDTGHIGFNLASRSNEAVVTGGGSIWSNRLDLYVGESGSFNRLVATNGGLVASSNAFVGLGGSSSNNTAVITGTNSFWDNRGDLTVGNGGIGNQLIVSNGALVGNNAGYIGRAVGGSDNAATVTGAGSVWSNAGTLTIGSVTTGNRLVVSDGGAVLAAGHGVLGLNTVASSNTAIVTDSGSRWLATSNLFVGSNGSFNRLVLSNGALMGNNFGFLGYESPSSNNEVVVTGANSYWSNRQSLAVGYFGPGNRLVVSNGGRVENAIGYVGNSSNNNQAVVTGTNSVWTNRSDLYVGDFDGSFNLLLVSSGGQVVNSNGFLGFTAASVNNTALVTGANSVWSNRANLRVGDAGSRNQVIVSNGGMVFTAGNGIIGRITGANSNTVLVTDAGSHWTGGLNSDLYVGSNGSFNRLVISNGAVADHWRAVQLGSTTVSVSNEVVVTGAGSVLSNSSFVVVGQNGAANRLTVSNGGTVASLGGEIGNSTNSINNEVIVTGAGSVWSNTFQLFAGSVGRGNRLVVSNGGLVFAANAAYVGFSPTATNSRVIVDGGTLRAANFSSTAVYDVRRGTNVFNAGLIDVDQLFVTNTSGVPETKFIFNGGTLITRGAFISSDITFSVGAGGTTPAIWDVRAGAINTVVSGNDIYIGSNSSFNQVLVTNGALLSFSANNVIVGHTSGAKSNTVTLAGIGSRWQNFPNLFVGSNGSVNRVIVSNGALLTNSQGIIGAAASALSNEVIVTGAGSIWGQTANLFVGSNGSGNRLTVSNGGVVVNQNGQIGWGTNANGNTALVTGTGSVWNNRGDLIVGSNGTFNRLVISNGGLVVNQNGAVGPGPDDVEGSLNTAVVTGAGSVWSNRGDLLVGDLSRGNLLVVSNGGLVVANQAVIGRNRFPTSFPHNNAAVVTDAGSRWLLQSNLYLGSNSTFNLLTMGNGGLVGNTDGYIGYAPMSSNHQALVTGAGSFWSNRGNLFVGESGNGNLLIVSNGGLVADRNGYLGHLSGSFNNLAVVTGSGSLWSNANDLFLGDFGTGNQLVVTNGGGVVNSNGFIGIVSSATGNSVVVTGTNSFWNNRADVRVGYDGSANRLTVSNGGQVMSVRGIIGGNSNANNNEVIVTGAGSRWATSNGLFLGVMVGSNGSGNRLVISDGAEVSAGSSALGQPVLFGSNNSAFVTGAGSFWSNQFDLDLHRGSLLVISNGGVVRDATGRVGAGGDDNVAIVTGAGSVWSNFGSLGVGVVGLRNRLVVSNSGFVYAGQVSVGPNINSIATRVIVDGGTLRVTNVIGTGFLDVARGTNVLNAGLIDVDRLVLTNAAGKFEFNGGTLITRSAFISNGAPVVVGPAGTGAATWDVRAGVSNHFLSGNLILGDNSSFNQLLITNGALLTNSGVGSVGFLGAGRSNAAFVSGAGSRWHTRDELYVGYSSNGNRLVISTGGGVVNLYAIVGTLSSSSNNDVLVTGTGSFWSNRGELYIGSLGSGNQLVVSNGGLVVNTDGFLGSETNSGNNSALVTGTGSLWSSMDALSVGYSGDGNRLVVSNGGMVVSSNGYIGFAATADNNVSVVTGPGSVWSNRSGLYIGGAAAGNELIVSNGGTVVAGTDDASGSGVFVGATSNFNHNRFVVDGGTLRAKNASGTSVLELRRGTNLLNSGLIDVDRLLLTFTLGQLQFNGGTLQSGGTTNNNTRVFTVGNGTSAATFRLLGGTHGFSNNLVISSNATLSGNGTILGNVTNFGTVSPGASAGKLRINGDLRLLPSAGMTFELGGLVASNQFDQIDVTNFVQFAGTLSLALINNFLPDDSDSFTLVSFGSSSGSFTNAPNAARVSLTNNLASFAVTYNPTSFVLGHVRYVDSDGDGQGDLQEQAAGTAGSDSTNFLQITSITQNASNHIVIEFQSVPGKNYRIEHTTNLTTGFTGFILSPPLTSLATNVSQFVDDGSLTGGLPATKRFYRIGLQ